MKIKNLNIFSEIRYYRKLSQEFQVHLSQYHDDWNKFQEIFNLSVDKVYEDILQFEKENIQRFENKIYKLKKIFEKRYRRYFLYGDYIRWCYDKPFGYSGDFKIIDNIYLNEPRSVGFDRLWDNYFQQLAAVKATRERKENFKGAIFDFVKKNKNKEIRIMNLACGPAREIKELLENDPDKLFSKVIFDCYDLDMNAINHAKQLLNNYKNVNFYQKNAIRIALKKNVNEEIPWDYDLIYSTGLFDYLDERIAIKLVANLKKLLKRDGSMLIANVKDKYSNSSACWMEWVAEWYLIYRTEEQFQKIFFDAGFLPKDLKIIPQKSNVMQYCIATNK